MPALVAFGRRWKVGSDDFLLPGLIDVTVKFCWYAKKIFLHVLGQFLVFFWYFGSGLWQRSSRMFRMTKDWSVPVGVT